MTRSKAAATAQAVDAAHAAYPAARHADGSAIHLYDLEAPEGLLDEIHNVALNVGDIAERRGMPGVEARQFV